MSNLMVAIESPWVLSYKPSIQSNIVSLTVFKIFEHQCSYALQWAGRPPLARALAMEGSGPPSLKHLYIV